MKKIILYSTSILLFGCGSSVPVKDDIGYLGQNKHETTVDQLLENMKADPNTVVRNTQGWHIAEVRSEQAIYSFTPEKHPAHPSFVKRAVVEKDGAVFIETTARCGAEKSVCDQLVSDFIKLNNKIQSDMVSE